MRPKNLTKLSDSELLGDFYQCASYINELETLIDRHIRSKNMDLAEKDWTKRQKYVRIRDRMVEEAESRGNEHLLREMRSYIV